MSTQLLLKELLSFALWFVLVHQSRLVCVLLPCGDCVLSYLCVCGSKALFGR